MATTQPNSILHHLRRASLLPDGGGLTDAQLLESFLARRDETAFEALVRRHGPMVFGVCRRILGNVHDSEDAFQATFLVLTCKAASIVPRELVGNWLHGVAYHIALKAKAMNCKRQAKERAAAALPKPEDTAEAWRQLEPLLDRTLQELPEKFRVPIVLCDLEGKTRKEAARQLGWAEGTVASRLARGRSLLAQRLARHGLELSGAVLAAALAQQTVSASVPMPMLAATLKAAALYAAGQAATAEVLSAKVIALTKGTLQAMLLTKLKIATTLVLAATVLALGGWFSLRPALPGALVSATAPPTDKGPDEKKDAKPTALLKWRFEKDKPFFQKLTATTDGTWMALNQTGKQTQTQTFYLRCTPLKKDGDTWIIRQKIEGVAFELSMGGANITPVAAVLKDLNARGTSLRYDSTKPPEQPNPFSDLFAALIGCEFTITLNTKDMTVTKIEGREQALDKMAKASAFQEQSRGILSSILSEKSLKQLVEFSFAPLPGTAKAAGDQWTHKRSFDMGNLKIDNQATYTYEGKDKDAPKLDRIAVKYTLTLDPKVNSDQPFKIKKTDLKSNSTTGTLYYSAAAGRVVRSEMELDLEGSLSISVGDHETDMPFKQKQKSSFEISDKPPPSWRRGDTWPRDNK